MRVGPLAAKTKFIESIVNVGVVPVSIGQLACAVYSTANKMEPTAILLFLTGVANTPLNRIWTNAWEVNLLSCFLMLTNCYGIRVGSDILVSKASNYNFKSN